MARGFCHPIVVGLIAGSLIPSAALAFKGWEHGALTDLACEVAAAATARELGADGLERLASAIGDCKPQSPASPAAICACLDLGRITTAVDGFTVAENIVPVSDPVAPTSGETPPARCRIRERATSAEEREALAKGDESIAAYVRERVESREKVFLRRLLAAHRNATHFERCAAVSYDRLHRRALHLAEQRQGKKEGLLVPLLTEAVALHFLQDSFPPGHLLTPRTSAPDAIARVRHNLRNRIGVAGFVADDVGSSWTPAVVAAWPECTAKASKCLAPTSPTPAAADRVPVSFTGDGTLATNGQEAVALAALSARSIAEVIARWLPADADPTGLRTSTMHVSFEEWSAAPYPSQIGIKPYSNPKGPYVPPKFVVLAEQPGGPVAVAGMGAEQATNAQTRTAGVIELAGGFLSPFQRGGGDGVRAEAAIALGLLSDRDVRVRIDDVPTDDYYEDDPFQGFYGGVLAREDFGRGFRSRAAMLFWTTAFHPVGPLQMTWSASLLLGVDKIDDDDIDTARYGYGLRVGLGLGPVVAELGWDRGYAPVSATRVERESLLTLGARFQVDVLRLGKQWW